VSRSTGTETHIDVRYEPDKRQLTYHWVTASWNRFDRLLQPGLGGLDGLLDQIGKVARRANHGRVDCAPHKSAGGPMKDVVISGIRPSRIADVNRVVSEVIRRHSRNQLIEIGWPRGLPASVDGRPSPLRRLIDTLRQIVYRV
jgi:hypothetical protein